MDSKDLLRQLEDDTLDRNAALDPDLRALVDFADWLAFPTELGRYPDDIEIADRRTLAWPPARGSKLPLWLIRYRVRDESGLDGDDVGSDWSAVPRSASRLPAGGATARGRLRSALLPGSRWRAPRRSSRCDSPGRSTTWAPRSSWSRASAMAMPAG